MDIEDFIARWTRREGEGGAERANYQMFLSELCDVLNVARPDVAGGVRDYVFERQVRPRESEGSTAPKRIDLYKKNAFILEAKQSRLPGQKNAIPSQGALFPEPEQLGRRSAAPRWDVMMQNARKQAEGYVFLLEADQPAPPFIIVCDVGHAFELYADFSGTGRAYGQFPDRKGYRIYLEDLRKAEVRERLAKIWTDPHSLDPTRESARVTREIAGRLAAVSKRLEDERGANPEDVAHFLMRCLFTMFAEDTELLPKDSFKALLEKCVDDPSHFTHRLKALWADMDKGSDFSHVIEARVRHFNGGLFQNTTAFELGREEIGELLAAARADWKQVDPAIFGTLLEQALDKDERRKLGAHYTPRAYVQRLVDVTVMEPLRDDWQKALTKAEQAKEDGDDAKAIAIVRAFHHQLCTTRVLDPACGTGNFLYVSLELMKKLEGEVLQTLSALGDRQASLAMAGESVDPHQFLGLELNPRAAAIAELVVWIGYLQWHYRNHESHPAEPILRAFKNINFGRHEGYDAVLTWDGYPIPTVVEKDGERVETYPNARRPDWPEAEFIVGNPPFIGNKRMREFLGAEYSDAVRAAHSHSPPSIDFVMYWWDRASEKLGQKDSQLRRFGLVTTNSISQTFNRRVIDHHIGGKSNIRIILAIPNHPWIKSDRSSAAVRIAMTVAERSDAVGRLFEVHTESGLDSDDPQISFRVRNGTIRPDLTLGADVSGCDQLLSNEDMAHQGVILSGEGFRLSPSELLLLGLDKDKLPDVVRPYLIGRDLVQHMEERYVIDFYGLDDRLARENYPRLFQIVLDRVKPQRDRVSRIKRRENFWLHAEPCTKMREAMKGLKSVIATCRTAKYRVFSSISSEYLPDTKIICITLSDFSFLSILTSRIHQTWAEQAGTRLGMGDDLNYNHSECFGKFPFPEPDETLKARLRALGEELDATRKRVQTDHPDLTLTGLYNVLEKLKAGEALTATEDDVKQRGLVLILKELHDQIDAATALAYGWATDLSDEEILERLVALNAERAKEEAAGDVRWLRPDYQIPRLAKGAAAKTGELDLGDTVVAIDKGLPPWPKDRLEQPLAIEAQLAVRGQPADAATLSRAFKNGGKKIEQRIVQALVNLARYGRIIDLGDGRYVARKAA